MITLQQSRPQFSSLKAIVVALLISSLLTLLLSHTARANVDAIGVTPGEFSVDQSGGANYQMPIAVPPGTAGMEPSLSLSYSSNTGNGVLGVGWTLGGLSVVTRCPATKVQDGFIDGIDFDNNDRFCIDGQRLIAINGTYGANNTEYRTEQDGFTKVISYGTQASGPQYFKAWTKSGQILEYGTTADSRIEAQGKTDVRLWAVNKIADTVGNYLTVSYNENNADGSYTPTTINYTGNDTTSLIPYAKVQFEYESRADITTAYFAGSKVKTTQRLKNIKTYVDAVLVRDYQLTYDNQGAANRSRLTQIQECDGTGSCFPGTGFGYAHQIGSGFEPDSLWDNVTTGFHNNWKLSFVDMNGDGLPDLVKSYVHPTTHDGTRVMVRINTGLPFPYHLTKITTGLNTKTEISYKPLTDNTVYTKGTGASYPEIDIQGAMYVVSSVKVDDGIGGQRETTYKYQGLRSSILRGSLGFASMSSTDVTLGLTTKTDYNQTYPYLGQVKHSEQRYNSGTPADVSDDILLSETDASFTSIQTHTGTETVASHTGTQFPYANSVIKHNYELSGTLISTISTNSSYDNYGNPTAITVTTTGPDYDGVMESYITQTNNIYINDITNWYLGRLTRVDVSQTLPNGTSGNRSSAFSYDATTGLLTQEVVEPDNPSLRLITDYQYDAYGNKISVTVSGGQ